MIEIVDSHHKVLLPWAKCRQGLHKAPRLITLDHHTDTSKPFRNFIKKHSLSPHTQSELLEEIDFMKLHTVSNSIEKLNNDEHIVTAIKTDVISSAFVIAHSAANTGLETYNEHKIACKTITDHDSVLESSILNGAFLSFNEILAQKSEDLLFKTPYILDIDLDYFNTFRSVSPKDPTAFNKLVENAELITIATEPEYVKHCSLDSGLTSDFILEALNKSYFRA